MSEDKQAESQPEVAEEQRQEEEFDPFGVDLDELRRRAEKAIEDEEQAAAAPATEESEDEDSQEPEEQETIAEEPEPESQEAQEASEEQADSEDMEYTDADELRAMLEYQQAEVKRLESQLGREAGAKGYEQSRVKTLEKQIADLRSRLSRDDEYVESGPTVPLRETEHPPASDPNTTYLVGLAIRDASNTFFAQNPGAFIQDNGEQKMDPAFEAALREEQSRAGDILTAPDPATAAEGVSRLLNAAYAKVERERAKARLDLIRRRRAEQGKRLKDKKRAAAAASPKTAAKRPTRRELDPYKDGMKMSMDELRKIAERESAGT